LVGTKLTVSIIGAQPKEGKLIFSEKGADDKEKKELIANYGGRHVSGEVTGMVDFGVFVKLEEGSRAWCTSPRSTGAW
jgi:ribosomal protein S1